MKGYKKRPFRKQDFCYKVVLEQIQKLGLYFPCHIDLKSGLQYIWGTPIGTPLEYSMELIHVLQLPFWKYEKFLTQQHKFRCQLYFVFFADKIWKILLLPPSSFITKRSFCVVKEAKINPMECLFAFLSPLLSLLDTIGTNQKSESDNYFLVCVFPVCVKIYLYCFFDHITKSDWPKIRQYPKSDWLLM